MEVEPAEEPDVCSKAEKLSPFLLFTAHEFHWVLRLSGLQTVEQNHRGYLDSVVFKLYSRTTEAT